MKAPILLHIPEPCHENWDAMTPQDKGRHCQSCNKIVVDFSVMTDRQVLDYFKNAKGNTCGRFYNDQLQRPLIEPQKQPSRWNYYVASIASFFMSVKLMAQESVLQGKVANPYGQRVTPNNDRQTKGEVAVSNTKTISGKVVDEKGAAITGVSITIDKTSKGSITDSSGRFKMNIPKQAKTITFRAINCETQTINLPSSGYINIKLLQTSDKDAFVVVSGGISVSYLDEREYYRPSSPIYDIKGVVFDENDNAIKDAVITVVGIESKTKTDYAGEFEIDNIKKFNLKTLHITATGYKTKSIAITKKILDEIEDLKIILQKEEVVVISNAIKGKITDEKGAAIAGASITIKGTKIGSVSKADGSFELNKLGYNTKLTIVISSIGYETKTMEVESKDLKNDLNIVLSAKSQGLTEIVLTTEYSSRKMGGLRMICTTVKTKPSIKKALIKPLQKLFNVEPIKIYPNPAPKNSTIHISIKDAGEYQLHLFDVQSRLILAKQITTTNNSQVTDLQLPDNIISGNYFIQLVNEKFKKQITEKIIVQ